MDEKIVQMPNTAPSVPTLSTRGGAMMLKSISLFLANSKHLRHQRAQLAEKQTKTRKKRMVDKDVAVKCSPKVLEAARKDTHFTREEIEILYKIYRKLVDMNKSKPQEKKVVSNLPMGKPTKVHEGIDRTVFRELLHNTYDIVTEDMLMDRIFCVWDKGNAGLLTPEAWFNGLSVYLKGTTREKIQFCFSVYDLNGDGYITKDEMFQLLKNCLIKQPQEEDPDESVKDLVEIVMRKLDKDKDGKVSPQDYQESIAEEPLLLEAFGNCLPTERARDTFMSTMHF